jgi:hypothetical protein
VATASRMARSASRPRSASQNRNPNWIIGPTSWSRYSNSVTTPKFPPPPRTAQNRSAFSSEEARRIRPSATTISTDSTLSQAIPACRVSQPMPPPRVRPPIPV